MKTTRRVICWKCEEDFRVDVEVVETKVVVVRGGESRIQKVKQKYIVRCPRCKAENEVRV